MSQGYEQQLAAAGFRLIAGADEAGRGSCAGPLVAAAVIWPAAGAGVEGVDDSKKLTPMARDRALERIQREALAWSVVEVSAAECDELGIQSANITALRRALLRLDPAPDFALLDGFAVDGLPFPSLGVWKGDQVAFCVSAASIIAKVTRDRIMDRLDSEYPGYGFAIHKGYVTAAHSAALGKLGPSPVHRLSFGNVAKSMACGKVERCER
jgi:ribonuclease HII